MSDDWAVEREKSVLDTIYYCETCNIVIERADPDVAQHKKELQNHKMRRVMILRCGRCGNVVTDSYAEYSPERNQFWCKNCISSSASTLQEFHTTPSK